MTNACATTTNPPLLSYDFQGQYYDLDRTWLVQITCYLDDDPQFTCSVPRKSLLEAVRALEEAVTRVELDLEHQRLLLPDQGDFTITYFTKD